MHMGNEKYFYSHSPKNELLFSFKRFLSQADGDFRRSELLNSTKGLNHRDWANLHDKKCFEILNYIKMCFRTLIFLVHSLSYTRTLARARSRTRTLAHTRSRTHTRARAHTLARARARTCSHVHARTPRT